MNRRNFLKTAGISLAGSLFFPELSFSEFSKNSKILKKRNDLYSLSELEVLARMIFGEARDADYLERVWIAHTPFNRLNDGKTYTGEGSLKNVLLKRINVNGKIRNQYSCFSDFKKNARIYENFKKTLNPELYEPLKWAESKILAENILIGNSDEYNFGQTSYVEKSTLRKFEKTKTTPEWIKRITPIKTPDYFSHQFFREA